jgi:hypothetical protein
LRRNWPITLILYVTIAGMEVCWFWAVLDLLGQMAADGSLPVLTLLGFYPVAFGVNRLLQMLPRTRGILSGCLAWAAAALLLGKIQFFGNFGWGDSQWLREFWQAEAKIFHTFTPESLAVASSAVLWGFGWRLAYVRIQFATFISEFQFGLAILLFVFFLSAQLGMKSAALIPVTLIFFLLALSGVSVAHASERDSWLSGQYKGQWFGFLLFSIGLILAFGLLISMAISPSLVQSLLSLLARAGLFILKMIEKIFLFLSGLFPEHKPGDLPSPARTAQMKKLTETPFVLFSDSTREVMRFLWSMLCLSLILIALWRVSSQIFDWFRRKLSGSQGVEVEPLPGAFREDLLDLLRRIFRAFRIKWPFRGGTESDPILVETAVVRRIYRRLLSWAAARGHSRNLSQTPHEYLEMLIEWLPESRRDLTLITDQYVQVRYSPSVPTEIGLAQLHQSWQRVRQVRPPKAAKKISED